jgi:DNA-directed RNA polymerase specialized sigma24 family protein
MDRFTERAHKPGGTVDRAVADPVHAIRALSDADLVRLRALARLWSRRLPAGHGWADLLNEAIARALDGSRQWPPGVPLVSFLSGIMRSICDDQLRRMRRERAVLVRCEDPEDLGAASEEAQSSPDPERILAAAQAVAAIHQMFADDPAALQIISGLAEGLSAREICALSRMSDRDYDTARKRMRRALLPAGLHRSGR